MARHQGSFDKGFIAIAGCGMGVMYIGICFGARRICRACLLAGMSWKLDCESKMTEDAHNERDLHEGGL